MLTPEQLREAREIAERATPGPWTPCLGSGGIEMTAIHFEGNEEHPNGLIVCDLIPDYMLLPQYAKDLEFKPANMRYLEQFNPQFVLQLLDELERTAGTTGQYAPLGSGAERSVPESLFKMKQDDWIEACHKIDALEAEREKLQFKYDTVRKMADELVNELEKERDEYKRQIAAHECRFTSLDHQALTETIEKLRAALKFSEAALDAVAVQTKGLVSKIARDAANEAREALK